MPGIILILLHLISFLYPSQKQGSIPVVGKAKNTKIFFLPARTVWKDIITVRSLLKESNLFIPTKISPTILQKEGTAFPKL